MRQTLHRQAGLSLIEISLSLALLAGMMVGLTWTANQYSSETRKQAAAQYMINWIKAADQYTQDNAAALAAVATPVVPATITTANLVAANLLPASTASTNPYGQTVCAKILEPAAGVLQGLVVSNGGLVIDDITAGEIAAATGPDGGFFHSDTPTTATGAYGGWSVATADYKDCAGAATAAGHLAGALFFNNNNVLGDYLYRGPVAGHPEANRMGTNLDLGGYRLTNLQAVAVVGSACGAGVSTGDVAKGPIGELLTCQGGIWKTQGSAYWQDPVANAASLPACNASTQWQTRIVQTPAIGTQPRAYTCDGASWVPLGLDNNGNLTLSGTSIVGYSGSTGAYGAMTLRGDKNGWAGAKFTYLDGTDAGTLMMHPTYSGFYRPGDVDWRWYVDNSGNTNQNGTATMANAVITGVAAVGGACATNGKIAHDGTGLLLSCQSGVWATQGGGLGVGQAWQNVTASRACGIGYTNNTGKPIMVNIYVGNTVAQLFPLFDAYVDGVLVATFNLRSWGANGGANLGSSVNFVVPNGSAYNCAMSGDVGVYSWTELR